MTLLSHLLCANHPVPECVVALSIHQFLTEESVQQRTNKSTDPGMGPDRHPQKHCRHFDRHPAEKEEQSGCQTHPLARCPDWETCDHKNGSLTVHCPSLTVLKAMRQTFEHALLASPLQKRTRHVPRFRFWISQQRKGFCYFRMFA